MALVKMWWPLRKIVRAYHLACARDDMRRRGLAAPVGVWVCARCRRVALQHAALMHHLCDVAG